MNSETPRLLRYTKIGNRQLRDGELWVAIIQGSPGKGGGGVVIQGRVAALVEANTQRITVPAVNPGQSFQFSANADYAEGGVLLGGADREVWGLDAAPPEIAAAWMKYQLLGRFSDGSS